MKVFKQKRKSILIIYLIIILILASLHLDPFQTRTTGNITEASNWTQTSKVDFNLGSLKNIEIIGTGSNGRLMLKGVGFDGWSSKSLSTRPWIREQHTMDCIYGTDKVLLFAGREHKQDTWVYDLSDDAWTDTTPTSKPWGKHNHGMATFWNTDIALVYGGQPTWEGDTWKYVLSLKVWIDKYHPDGPVNRESLKMSSIWGTSEVIMHGGNKGIIYYGDTWLFNLANNSWYEITSPTGPGSQSYHAMAPIYETDKVVLYSSSGDTWIYDHNNYSWKNAQPVNSPKRRFYPALVSMHGSDKVFMFGGQDANNDLLNESWVYDLSDNKWTQKHSIASPTPRQSTAMAPIYNTNKVILFGGWDGSNSLDDTWIYTFKQYYNGTFISAPFDTGANSTFKTISWSAHTSASTNITFQLRTASTEWGLDSKIFIGPDGTSSSYYYGSSADIWINHTGDRWIQYKAFLNTTDNFETPSLNDVSISYNCLPESSPLKPKENSILNNNKPTFNWNFYDFDSDAQAAFQILIDNEIDFENVKFNSSEQSSGGQSWQFPQGTSYTSIPDGTWYWKVRTKDNSGDWGFYCAPVRFLIDTKSPESNITYPINNAFYSQLKLISGKCKQDVNGSEVEKLELTIMCISDNLFWSGSHWVPTETWLLATGTYHWSFDTSKVIWTSGEKYLIRSRGTDLASNVEMGNSGISFSIDQDEPVGAIYYPNEIQYLNNLETISGQGIDLGGAGLKSIEICIKNNKTDQFWDGEKWSYLESWLLANGTTQWTYDATTVSWVSDYDYVILVRAIDDIDNVGVNDKDSKFIFDNKPPEHLAISINNWAKYTNFTEVTLSLEAEDSGSGIAHMALSTNNQSWSAWKSLKSEIQFNSSSGDGEKIIYFKVQDNAGNTGGPIFSSIILDTTLPENLSIVINEGDTHTDSAKVLLNLHADDKVSGINQISFSTDGVTWSVWEDYKEVTSYNLPTDDGDGIKTIYFRAMDHAGNIADPIKESIILDTSHQQNGNGPSKKDKDTSGGTDMFNMVWLVILIILIIIIAIFFMIYRNKQGRKQKQEISSKKTITMKPQPQPQAVVPTFPPTQPPIHSPLSQPQAQSPTKPIYKQQTMGTPQMQIGGPKVAQQQQQQAQKPCSTCGQSLELIQFNHRYYCYRCKRYE